MKVFFDESGNTGTNWLNIDQPYFVYGGWMIKNEKYNLAIQKMNEVFSTSKAGELKSNYILNKKRYLFFEMFDCLVEEVGAIPVFGIVDKKYMIAAKVVETFFDYEYNDNVTEILTHRSRLKKALADSISKNDQVLVLFSKLIKEGTISLLEMKKIQDELAKHFKNLKLLEVEKSIGTLNEASLCKMIKEFECVSNKGTEKRWLTLIEPILFERLSNIDYFCQLIGDTSNVYIDQLRGFDDVLLQMNEIIQRRGIIKNITSIEMKDSKGELMIQAADLLCGYVSKCFTDNEKNLFESKDRDLWKDLISIKTLFLSYNITIWDYYAHDSFIGKIEQIIGNSLYKSIHSSVEVISSDYSFALKSSSK